MTFTVGSLLGVPTTTRLTIGMSNIVNNEQQPITPAAEARLGLRLSQAQQFRRRRRPHYSYFGSTISPLATARQLIADLGAMAGTGNGDFTMIYVHLSEETMSALQQPRLKASTRAVPLPMPKEEQTMPRPTATANPVSPPDTRPTGHNGETGP
eukprot:3550976-Amphidinium_carterae.2